MHIHLDAVGGIAGDMFAAALLDTWPELTEQVIATIRLAGLAEEVALERQDFNDGVLTGSKFKVTLTDSSASGEPLHPDSNGGSSEQNTAEDKPHTHQPVDHSHHHSTDHKHHHHHHGHQDSSHDYGHEHDHSHEHDHGHEHDHSHGHHHDHGHHQWSELKQRLANSAMPDTVKRHTLGIFTELAIAEATVHGKDVDTVTFHEVGNWDSIADIVAAATLIDALSVQSWSVSPLPIGRGLVRTAHGELPVPAPATTLLLDGFAFRDDGRAGERVTPTGAAILKYLAPASDIGQSARTLCKSGFGFGNRKLPGMSNVLRVMAFAPAKGSAGTANSFTDNFFDSNEGTRDTVGVIQFEIDDQSGEELAATLEHIRASDHVLDATQAVVFGKKGRMMAAIQVLTKPDAIDSVAQLCFQQSTTLGLRTRIERRQILRRHDVTVDNMRVKLAERPAGITAKAEMDSVQRDARGHHARSTSRLHAQAQAEARVDTRVETKDKEQRKE